MFAVDVAAGFASIDVFKGIGCARGSFSELFGAVVNQVQILYGRCGQMAFVQDIVLDAKPIDVRQLDTLLGKIVFDEETRVFLLVFVRYCTFGITIRTEKLIAAPRIGDIFTDLLLVEYIS